MGLVFRVDGHGFRGLEVQKIRFYGFGFWALGVHIQSLCLDIQLSSDNSSALELL